MSTHAVDVMTNGRHGYPYRAVCACGWRSNTYASAGAAWHMADDHTNGEGNQR